MLLRRGPEVVPGPVVVRVGQPGRVEQLRVVDQRRGCRRSRESRSRRPAVAVARRGGRELGPADRRVGDLLGDVEGLARLAELAGPAPVRVGDVGVLAAGEAGRQLLQQVVGRRGALETLIVTFGWAVRELLRQRLEQLLGVRGLAGPPGELDRSGRVGRRRVGPVLATRRAAASASMAAARSDRGQGAGTRVAELVGELLGSVVGAGSRAGLVRGRRTALPAGPPAPPTGSGDGGGRGRGRGVGQGDGQPLRQDELGQRVEVPV